MPTFRCHIEVEADDENEAFNKLTEMFEDLNMDAGNLFEIEEIEWPSPNKMLADIRACVFGTNDPEAIKLESVRNTLREYFNGGLELPEERK